MSELRDKKLNIIVAAPDQRFKKELQLKERGDHFIFFTKKINRLNDWKAGFTLTELLIVIAIMVIIATFSVMNLVSHQRERDLNLATQEIVTVIRNAQDRSIAQENGDRWGVYFENSLSGNDFYELFKGASYATATIISKVFLPSHIQFDIPAVNSSTTVIFSPITGLPNNSTSIKISLVGAPKSSSSIIINSNGEIIY